MAEIVVADAGPLIAFGRLRRIEILARVFEKVVVPRVVLEETQFHPGLPDAQAIASARDIGLFVVENLSPDVFPARAGMNRSIGARQSLKDGPTIRNASAKWRAGWILIVHG